MNHLGDRVDPKFAVDRFTVVMDCAPSDFQLFTDLFVGRTAGEASGNIELTASQMAAGFSVEKAIQFWDIGFGTACCDRGMAVECLF